MVKKRDFQKSDPIVDLKAQINADFNSVINKTHRSLSTKTHSPVWTGFFASSWKVATTGIKARDDARKFAPWKSIRKQESIDFFNRKPSRRPSNPTIRIRYPNRRTFNIDKPVFIGNRAKHAAYALESGKVQNFIQGRLAKIIRDTMKERPTKGRIFLQSRQTPSLTGRKNPSAGYTEINL
jgi:hypothetical protein|tara:strand:+ start:84 stop:626 length:543 start_codon:yes stop_codon:yes gene_type:complete